MMMSILIFSLIPKDWLFIEKFLSRIVLIPFIAGSSYEFVKYSSKKMHVPIVRIMATPGLWLQQLTTGIPSRDQIEVAIRALKEVLHVRAGDAGKEEGRANAS
jgi:uncharacterized protein YqhQ